MKVVKFKPINSFIPDGLEGYIRLTALSKKLVGDILTQFFQLFRRWVDKRNVSQITLMDIKEFTDDKFVGKYFPKKYLERDTWIGTGDAWMYKVNPKNPTEKQSESATGLSLVNFTDDSFAVLRYVAKYFVEDILEHARDIYLEKSAKRRRNLDSATTLTNGMIVLAVRDDKHCDFIKINPEFEKDEKEAAAERKQKEEEDWLRVEKEAAAKMEWPEWYASNLPENPWTRRLQNDRQPTPGPEHGPKFAPVPPEWGQRAKLITNMRNRLCK